MLSVIQLHVPLLVFRWRVFCDELCYYVINNPSLPPRVSTEILGVFISVISIWIVTGALVYLAIERIVHNDYEINGHVMLVTSGCAVIVNIV